MKTYDKDVTELCRDRLRPIFNEACESDDRRTLMDKALMSYEGMFIAITNIDVINIPELILKETKSPVGPFDKENTEFEHLAFVRNKGQSYFVISDSAGYIT